MTKEEEVKLSKSELASPVVLVLKADTSLRLSIDYRRLNEVTKRDSYPLLRIEECLDF
eukprot:IDg16891t1